MKVLVTGATSGLGRNAVEYLRNKGISVRATGRNEAMGKLLSKMGAEFIPADLTELVSSQAKVMLAGIDTLWHCSSFTSPWAPSRLSISLTSAPPAVWANGLWHGGAQFRPYLFAIALFRLSPPSRYPGRFPPASLRQRVCPQQGGQRGGDQPAGAGQPAHPFYHSASAELVRAAR